MHHTYHFCPVDSQRQEHHFWKMTSSSCFAFQAWSVCQLRGGEEWGLTFLRVGRVPTFYLRNAENRQLRRSGLNFQTRRGKSNGGGGVTFGAQKQRKNVYFVKLLLQIIHLIASKKDTSDPKVMHNGCIDMAAKFWWKMSLHSVMFFRQCAKSKKFLVSRRSANEHD